MNWILDNLQMVLAVGGALAYWLHQRKQAAEGGPEDLRDSVPTTRPDADAMEAEERTRQIQEEIRRKIRERLGEPEPPPLMETGQPEQPEPPIPARWREQEPEEGVPAYASEPPPLEQVVLAQQLALEEKMEALAAERAAARARARVVHFPGGSAARAASALVVAERGLVAELRDPRSLRRAVVLREILGPPVALR